jgi:threonine aldolase
MEMKGWKTVVFGLVVAVAPAALNYVGGIDWTSLGLSPSAGAAIGAIIIGLRAITNTSIGSKT